MRLFATNERTDKPSRTDRFAGLTVPALPRLKDPEKPRIDIAVGDLLDGPVPQSWEDDALYKFVVDECWKSARDARWHWELGWNLAVEFYNGNQHYGIDQTTKAVYNLIADDADPSRFLTVNMIKPRLKAIASMVTQSAPQAMVVPLTNSAIDRQAAATGRAIQAHYNQKHKIKVLIREAVDWSLTHTTAFGKSTFEPGVMVMTPRYGEKDAEGKRRIIGSEVLPEGDISERIIPGARVYLDPAALKFEDCRWLIHAELYPKSWYADNFENGDKVQADSGGGVVNYAGGDRTQGVSAAIGFSMARVGDNSPKSVNKDVATCYEMWILPGIIASFPYGALIRCAGGQVLIPRKSKDSKRKTEPDEDGRREEFGSSDAAWGRAFKADIEKTGDVRKIKKRVPGNYVPWPYDCVTEFPFVPLAFERNPNSPYGMNLVEPLEEPQQDLNRTLMRIRERLEKEKPVLLRESLDGVGNDQYADMGVYAEVKVRTLTAGTTRWVVQPEISTAQFKILENIQLYMDDIAGIHDPNFRGEVSSDASGVAINGLKEGDASRLSEFGANIESFVQGLGEWRLRHAAQFFTTDRLMGMDDTGNPAKKPGIVDHAKITLPLGAIPNLQAAMASPANGNVPPSIPSMAGSAAGIGGPAGAGIAQPMAGADSSSPDSLHEFGVSGTATPTTTTQRGSGRLSDVDEDNDGDLDDDPTNNPYANAVSFEALSQGGQCRVKVIEGTALADTPDAADQKIMAMYGAQLFGAVGSPGPAKIAVSLLKSVDSPVLLERLTELQERMDAEAAMKLPPPPPPPPDPMQIAQAQAQMERDNYAAKVQADTQSKIALQNADVQNQIAIIKAKSMYPSASIAFKGDQPGTMAVEENMNLPIHDTAAHLATVAHAGGIGHGIHNAFMPGQPDPVMAQEQQERDALAMQQSAESQAGSQPPPPDPAIQQEQDEAAADAELQRKKGLVTHQANEKIRVDKATTPPPNAGA